MHPSFAEEDFSFRPSYVRMLDGDSDRCLCLVNQLWLQKLVQKNKRHLTLEEPNGHGELSDIEIEILLHQPQSPLVKEPWRLLELHRLPLFPTASIRKIADGVLGGVDAGNPRNLDEVSEELFFSSLQDSQNVIQAMQQFRKRPKSIQAILHQDDPPVTELAADVVRFLCQSVLRCPFLDFSGQSAQVEPIAVANILQPVFVSCMGDHFVVALPYRPFTLLDCLRFSPGLLFCDAAKYFVLFQALTAICHVQEFGFFAGNVGVEDIVVRNDLWIEVKPINIFLELRKLIQHQSEMTKPILVVKESDDDDLCKISEWTTLWCLGKISNHDYLLAINLAAGRTVGHPDYHPIFPWVVDFTSRQDGWRDLTKSKYRLTKGDNQLDLTFEFAENGMVPHHIPETFSDLTYYIYNARRIPKTVLCQHVRKRWVPAEYPSTLERLYKWSPDECIPEFFSDPEIFRSIHDDLPDLGIPFWCNNLDEFFTFHRAALESEQVSSNLHHWIDLNFGYKLAGEAAVLSKNVVLSMKASSHHLKTHGMQQLFSHPHPPKFSSYSWLSRDVQPTLLAPVRTTSVVKKKSGSVDNLSTMSGGDNTSDDISMENVDAVLFGEDSFNPYHCAVLEDLEILENLIDFCFNVDREQPKVLEDYVQTHVAEWPVFEFLRHDLHAFACLAVEIFSLGKGMYHWPKFPTIQKRLTYDWKMFISSQRGFGTGLVTSFREILSRKIFPYTARQMIQQHERIFPFPPYMAELHAFINHLGSRADQDTLEDILERMDWEDLDILSVFLKQLLQNSPERHKWACLLLDPVVKYFGPTKSAEDFLPLLSRLYAESPPISSLAEHSAYLQLFEVDFLGMMLIRLGLCVFLKFLMVPLIEKLTGIEELVSKDGTSFFVGDAGIQEEEQIFSVDYEDTKHAIQDDSVALRSVGMETDLDSAQSRTLSVLIWLAEKIGPVLTAKHISGNLLKSLSLCYVEEEQLQPLDIDLERQNLIQRLTVMGDVAAWGVSDALLQISFLYGHCFIWDHYFSYCAELIKDALRRLTQMNEAGLLGCVEMMHQILPHVTEAALVEHLPFQMINEILYPIVELITSFVHLFPSGAQTRRLLTVKWLNLVFVLANRIGRDSARELITHPLLVTFFGVFTQLYSSTSQTQPLQGIPVPQRSRPGAKEPQEVPMGSPFITIRKDSESGELTVGTPVHVTLDGPRSPPVPQTPTSPCLDNNADILTELRAVFTEVLASDAYIPFCKLLGQFHMDEKLINNDLLHEICVGNPVVEASASPRSIQQMFTPRLSMPSVQFNTSGRSVSQKFLDPESGSDRVHGSKSFTSPSSTTSAIMQSMDPEIIGDEDIQNVEAKEALGDRILRGNWLAYWQHELGQSRRDEPWNTKQIPLQTFSAHSGPVKSLLVFDSEYSFMSGSKDKTVRLWSIRNSGNGSVVSQAEGHYLDHKKAVFELRFLSRERLAASCDGVVNLWDPWTLTTVHKVELITQANCIDCSATPSSALFVGHLNEETCFVSRFDVRCRTSPCSAGQFRVSSNTVGLIRCLVVSPDDNWFACGFSSGVISVFDQRTGIMSATWKPYESDVVHLIPVTGSILVSIGSDNSIAVWDLKRDPDDRLLASVRGFTEPVLQACFAPRGNGDGDLVALLGNSRVGVIGDLLRGGLSISSTKIRQDMLKGQFLTLTVLPLNRQLLVGNENGSSLLLC